ncbi:PAS domain-containing protein [Spirulina major]|uniref:PAS domain-containing protein n=1 Tax=Spirulina major TaxID=270636 RepID=UPI0009330E91|nr:PAS domain-containing protein [Spirulina major]
MSPDIQGDRQRIAALEAENAALREQLAAQTQALSWHRLTEDLRSTIEERTRELEASQLRLQRVAANLPGVIYQFRMDADGTYRFPYVSEGCRDLYELEPESFITAFSYVHPDDLPGLQTLITTTAQTLERAQYEHRIITPSGQLKWVELLSKPERTAEGAIVWDGLIVEITARKQAEIALVDSEQRFQSVCEQTGQLIYDYNIASGNIRWMGAMEAMTGHPPDAFKTFNAQDWAQWIHPDDREKTLSLLNDCMAAGRPYNMDYRLRRRDGSYIYVEDRGIFFRDETGQAHRMLGTMADIDDRKAAEEELRESRAELLALFSAIQDVILVMDRDGRYLKIASSSAPLLYQPAETSIGRTLHEIFPVDLADFFLAYIQQAVDTQELVRMDYSLPLGDRIVYFDSIIAPQQENTVVIVARDITSLKEVEAALREKDALLQTTLEAGKLGCWRWNRCTNDVFWSSAVERVFGLEVGLLGRTFKDYVALIHPDDLDATLAAVEQALATETDYSIEHRVLTPTGGVEWIRANGSIWRDGEGHCIGLLGSVLNITEMKNAEIALRESAAQIQQQADREQLLNQLTQQIRHSLTLHLDHILNTSVRDIQAFLKVDRCHFAWYLDIDESHYWEVVTEVVIPGLPSLVGRHPVAAFGSLSDLILQRRIVRLDDTSAVDDPRVRSMLQGLGNRSMLVLPVWDEVGDRYGVFACTQSQGVRPWLDDEVELLEAVVGQLAIALTQASLLAQSQTKAAEAAAALAELQRTQLRLVQSEKMSSLGQLVAGVAHEINNPVNFIHGNLAHADEYSAGLIQLVNAYQHHYPDPQPEIADLIEDLDLEFLKTDFQHLLQSMRVGTERIRAIVQSLRTFSRLDESEIKDVNIHDGIDSTLMILQTRLRASEARPAIAVIKDYGALPLINCYAGQLNQVFMNLLVNAIDALEERDQNRSHAAIQADPSKIRIVTRPEADGITIAIIDNGSGITSEAQARLFDPFFTTKAIGKGTGLGLSISYQIITENHQGQLTCTSQPGQTCFWIKLPLRQSPPQPGNPPAGFGRA